MIFNYENLNEKIKFSVKNANNHKEIIDIFNTVIGNKTTASVTETKSQNKSIKVNKNISSIEKDKLPNVAKNIMCNKCMQKAFFYNEADSSLFIFDGENVYRITDSEVDLKELMNKIYKNKCEENKKILEELIQICVDKNLLYTLVNSDFEISCVICGHKDTLNNFFQCFISPYKYGIEDDSNVFCRTCGEKANENIISNN